MDIVVKPKERQIKLEAVSGNVFEKLSEVRVVHIWGAGRMDV